MGLKEDLKKGVDNVKDAFDEAGHKANAETERETREVAGDVMTPAEKIRSFGNEVKEETLAGFDHAKRDVRENT